MKIVNMAAVIACSFLTVLLLLMGWIDNPEVALYEKTIDALMTQEGLTSYQATADCFPELMDIQAKMERVAYLEQSIQVLSRGPAPSISRKEALQINVFREEIRQLRGSVQQELKQLGAPAPGGQP